jgi:hypothetical protein
VVAHEDDLAIRTAATGRDHAHAVMRIRRRLAVCHWIAGPGVRAVLESFGQLNEPKPGFEVRNRN